MAYNVLKGTIEGSVDQHADQEIGGVKVFKNTVSASVFWDTDAQSPCATMKDVAITKVNGNTKGGILIYENEGSAKINHSLSYKDNTLRAIKINANSIAGSGKELFNLPTDQFDGEISAAYLNHSNGLHNVRGALQVKTSDCITVEEDGVGINLDADCGLWLKSNKLTLDLTKTEAIDSRGQNLSDDDLLLVADISTNRTNSTTLKNLYDGYLRLKVPHATGTKGNIQFKGNSEFESCPKLNYDSKDNTLKIEGKINSKTVQASKKLVCNGAVYHNITKTSDSTYQVLDDDYTILCDSSQNKVTVQLPPPCNSAGRVVIIKKTNSDRYKINSNAVEICCEESKIDISDSVTLKSNYSTRTLQSDGETWLVINKIG
tara:strand:- start:284 stop:1408 length:1125 start_codon:yes stop_codon:yes gene_type:complete